jgi:hypothetical protein
MAKKEKFLEEISSGYTFEGKSLVLGGAMLAGECQTGTLVKVPLETQN